MSRKRAVKEEVRINDGFNYDSPIIVDVETNGISASKHQIIQIAAEHPETGDRFERKIKFKKKGSDPEALEINGYSKKKWKDAVTAKEAATDFALFCKTHASSMKYAKKTGRAYPVAVLAGYNILAFDKHFITKWFRDADVWAPFDYRMYDVYAMLLFLYQGWQKYSLKDAAETLGLEHGELHEAMEDVLLTTKIFAILVDNIDSNPPAWVKRICKENEVKF